jgi:endonuclease YncB( thermonuclease family)
MSAQRRVQTVGKTAKGFPSGIIFGGFVEVEPVTVDRYGRTVALVVTAGDTLVKGALLRQGARVGIHPVL